MGRYNGCIKISLLATGIWFGPIAKGQIYNWQTGQVIPGTEGMTPGPYWGVSDWDTASQNLQYADFSGDNLTSAGFDQDWVDNARFTGANLSYASMNGSFTGADFTGANLYSTWAWGTVTGANFTNANVVGAEISSITPAQLYSTASYQNSDLHGIEINGYSGVWNLSGQDLMGAELNDFSSGNFSNADLTDAYVWQSTTNAVNLAGATVLGATLGISASQLYATSSYQAKDLRAVTLGVNIGGWNLSGQNLMDASFAGATGTGTNFTGANLINADFSKASISGAIFTNALIAGADFGGDITAAQLASTASYQNGDLHDINLTKNSLSGINLTNQNLTGAIFTSATLTSANFSGANLSIATFSSANLTNAKLGGANLTSANLQTATITGADFTNAVIAEATLPSAFTAAQLASTLSYKNLDLHGIVWTSVTLSGFNFANQNLTNANFSGSTFTSANWAGANLTGINFSDTTVTGNNFTNAVITSANFLETEGFTASQLYSTASYAAGDLHGVQFPADVSNWNFAGKNLCGATFSSVLTNANFSGANIAGATFGSSQQGGPAMTMAQLCSTSSYQAADLHGVTIYNADLTGGNFVGQNLTSAEFYDCTLTNASFAGANLTGFSFANSSMAGVDLSNAIITGANLGGLDFDPTSLYSTANYQNHDLRGIEFGDMSYANLANQNLTGAALGNLTSANLSGANLTDASIYLVTNANFTGATITGDQLSTNNGFTAAQLYSTASYQEKNLAGISFSYSVSNIAGWDFSGENLTGAGFASLTFEGTSFRGAILDNADFTISHLDGADFTDASLTGANFTAATLGSANFAEADLRGAINFPSEALPNFRNAIMPDASIQGLNLLAGDRLIIRNYPATIAVHSEMVMNAGSTLEFDIDGPQWQSPVQPDAGVVPELGGTLELDVVGADPHTLVGDTFDLFNWSGGLAANNQFAQTASNLPSDLSWDLSDLYSAGTARLISLANPTIVVPKAVPKIAVAAPRVAASDSSITADFENFAVLDNFPTQFIDPKSGIIFRNSTTGGFSIDEDEGDAWGDGTQYLTSGGGPGGLRGNFGFTADLPMAADRVTIDALVSGSGTMEMEGFDASGAMVAETSGVIMYETPIVPLEIDSDSYDIVTITVFPSNSLTGTGYDNLVIYVPEPAMGAIVFLPVFLRRKRH